MPLLPDSRSLLSSLIALPGPPGHETAVRDYVCQQLTAFGCSHETDGKGNLLAALPGSGISRKPRIVVTAHLDEIALLVTAVLADGSVLVQALGGAFPWKWGEGPVALFGREGTLIPGLLSF